jgi:hypothetical protein
MDAEARHRDARRICERKVSGCGQRLGDAGFELAGAPGGVQFESAFLEEGTLRIRSVIFGHDGSHLLWL